MGSAIGNYAFINAKLRARISKMLDENFFNSMIRTRSLAETIELLKPTEFSEIEAIYNKTGDLKMAELEIHSREIKTYIEVKKYVEKEILEFVSTLTLKYEIEVLKNVIRLWFDRSVRKRNIDNVVGYIFREKIINEIDLDGIINSINSEEVLSCLKGTPYYSLLENVISDVETNKNIFASEIALDHYFYERLMESSAKLGRKDFEIIKRLVGVEIDLQNLNWITRFKEFYNLPLDKAVRFAIPNGLQLTQEKIKTLYASENVTELLKGFLGDKYKALGSLISQEKGDLHSRLVLVEKILEEIMMLEVKHVLGGNPFTIGTILAYFILKQEELRKIMIILNAKYYAIESDRIKSIL